MSRRPQPQLVLRMKGTKGSASAIRDLASSGVGSSGTRARDGQPALDSSETVMW